MVTRDEIVELVTGEYPNMKVSYVPGEYEIIEGDNVHLTLLPAFSIRHSLEDTRRMIGRSGPLSNYKVKKIYVEGSTDLTNYNDLFKFSEFIDEELEGKDLDRSHYSWGSKIAKILNIKEEFNGKELLDIVGSVMDAEQLFAEIYRKNEEDSLRDYDNSKRLFYSSQIL